MHRMGGMERLVRGVEHVMDMEAEPSSPRAGEPVQLMFTVREKSGGRPVSSFGTVHHRQMHLIAVSRDLALFHHLHPELEGHTFSVQHTFEEGTTYDIWAEATPQEGQRVLHRFPLPVIGPPFHRPTELKDSGRKVQCDDGKHVATLFLAPVGPSVPVRLSYWLEGERGPVSDLQPCLGAKGHCVVISEDGEDFLHAHPAGTDGSPGPQVVFETTFPRPGRYKLWGQFRAEGRTFTAAHVVTVR